MKKRFSISTVCALMFLVAAATFTITFVEVKNYFNSQLSITAEQQGEIKKYLEAKENLEASFIGEIDLDLLMDMSIAGMVEGLGDSSSYYMNREDYARYKESQTKKYVDVGIKCGYDATRDALVVTEVQPDSPADKAGIVKFDIIVAVNGQTVSVVGANTVMNEIAGEEGTTVKIDLVGSDGMRKSVELVRRQTNIEAVKSEMLDGNIGYVNVLNFDTNAGVDFKDRVKKLVEADAKGIVFDLRFVSGGKRQELTIALDSLISEGVIVVSGDKNGQKDELAADAEGVDLPMAVLVNEYTLNAGEYFAAVLQEYGKATVIGQKTPGNLYIQVPVPLNDASAIMLSTREYITPKGAALAGKGVTPDINVVMSPEDIKNFNLLSHEDDNQLTRAITELRSAIEAIEAKAASAE